MKLDSICAIATPYGVGAISIIRVSGEDTFKLIKGMLKGLDIDKQAPNTIHHAWIMDHGEILDEVLISKFVAPNSFTGENSIEINCHGGVYNTNKVLEALLSNGFRLANPGEFSTRGYLNKKMDLTKAEAIMDLISAENDKALKASINSLRNETYKLISNMRERLLDLIAKIEVNIDYPEYDDAIVMTDKIITPILESMILKMEEILESSKISTIVIHGIKTAIVGRPNVGKSSLLNLLLDEEKAIVTNIPGTTRDIVEGKLSLNGITLNLIDTAGIREGIDLAEKIGIERSLKAINEAELILLVLDGSQKLTDLDNKLLELTKDKVRIIITNKNDLDKELNLDNAISISTKSKDGIKKLLDKIYEVTRINEFNPDNGNYLSNSRQVALLKDSMNHLKEALNASKKHVDVDMIELDIKDSWSLLGEIIGETDNSLLIKELFSKFCLGK
jgi:tRNA modification GTPase